MLSPRHLCPVRVTCVWRRVSLVVVQHRMQPIALLLLIFVPRAARATEAGSAGCPCISDGTDYQITDSPGADAIAQTQSDNSGDTRLEPRPFDGLVLFVRAT